MPQLPFLSRGVGALRAFVLQCPIFTTSNEFIVSHSRYNRYVFEEHSAGR